MKIKRLLTGASGLRLLGIPVLVALLMLISCGGDKVPAYKPPAAAELAPVKLPPITEKTLDNGLKLIVIEHHELPVISFRLMVKSGSVSDPRGLEGLASFTADLMTKGTKSRSATDIAREIDFVGGSLGSSAGWDRWNVHCSVLKRHFDVGLDLFADIALNPVFQKDEIERLRTQSISSYKTNLQDPGFLANVNYSEFLYGNNRFALPSSGTDETLKNIRRPDIENFYAEHFLPNNAVLAVSGDVDSEEIFKALEDKFGGWKKRDTKEIELPQAGEINGYKILLVNKTDATQSQIRIGHFGLPRSNEDYFPISLMNYIFGGGGFASRLMKTVRADMGLTYSVRSNFDFRKLPGPFTISTFTKNESVGEAIEEIIKLMKGMQVELVEEDELDDAQSFLTGSYPMRFETPNQMASQLLYVELHNLGADYIENYRGKVQSVTREESLEAAKKYLHPNNMVIVVVGKKDEVYDQLTKYGEVEVKELN